MLKLLLPHLLKLYIPHLLKNLSIVGSFIILVILHSVTSALVASFTPPKLKLWCSDRVSNLAFKYLQFNFQLWRIYRIFFFKSSHKSRMLKHGHFLIYLFFFKWSHESRMLRLFAWTLLNLYPF